MANFPLRLHRAVAVALLAVATGCSSAAPPDSARSTSNSTTSPVADTESPTACPQIDPFTKGINKAMGAATLAQSAYSKRDWDLVVSGWIAAIEGMQAVPPDNPKYAFAQKKVVEYLQNLDVALQKASSTRSPLPFASFNNPIFEEQLLLYLSYIAAVGPPDVLIVGSSRALVGIDPQQLQQALASRGKPGLKVFNFGVNGATAQFVEFQLRQLLTPEQLPRLILWADGVRAFNSGRTDKTFNSLVASQGYRQLMAGNRPTLPERSSPTADACETLPETTLSQTSPLESGEGGRLTRVAFAMTSNPKPTPDQRLLLTQFDGTAMPQRLTLVRNTTGYSSFAIDANGFLPMDDRFDPNLYYQQNPQVAGLYDADYQPFSFSGQQANAFQGVQAFAREQQIPLVLVNLPLSESYLDAERLRRERQFQQLMQPQANGSEGFIFVDLGRAWLNRDRYFADPSHINRYGAAAVANQLANNPAIPWPQPRP